jgi:hypothetical protein
LGLPVEMLWIREWGQPMQRPVIDASLVVIWFAALGEDVWLVLLCFQRSLQSVSGTTSISMSLLPPPAAAALCLFSSYTRMHTRGAANDIETKGWPWSQAEAVRCRPGWTKWHTRFPIPTAYPTRHFLHVCRCVRVRVSVSVSVDCRTAFVSACVRVRTYVHTWRTCMVTYWRTDMDDPFGTVSPTSRRANNWIHPRTPTTSLSGKHVDLFSKGSELCDPRIELVEYTNHACIARDMKKHILSNVETGSVRALLCLAPCSAFFARGTYGHMHACAQVRLASERAMPVRACACSTSIYDTRHISSSYLVSRPVNLYRMRKPVATSPQLDIDQHRNPTVLKPIWLIGFV